MPPFMHAVIQWLLCSFIPSLIRATIHSYMYLCCNSFMASLIFVANLPFIQDVIRSCSHSFMASFTHAVTYLLRTSWRHSLMLSRICCVFHDYVIHSWRRLCSDRPYLFFFDMVDCGRVGAAVVWMGCPTPQVASLDKKKNNITHACDVIIRVIVFLSRFHLKQFNLCYDETNWCMRRSVCLFISY